MNLFKSNNSNANGTSRSTSINSSSCGGKRKFSINLLTLHDNLLSTMTTTILFIFFIGCVWPVYVSAARPPTLIVVNKCCRNGEELDIDRQCSIGGTEQWWPLIYMIVKQTYYLPHGEAPRFFKVRERAPPICDNAEFITGIHNMALFSNGTLFLPERQLFIEADKFCVDKDTALVCYSRPHGMDSLRAPIQTTKIHKCCPRNSIYDANASNCVQSDDDNEIQHRKLVKNAKTSIEYLYGFPKNCNDNNSIAIAGKFNESTLEEETGNLSVAERTLHPNEYCLEHLNDSDAVNAHVFTCAEYLQLQSPKIEVAAQSKDNRFLLFSIALLISVVFLIATLGTGFLLPTNHHVLHWRCQTYYFACLLVGDILLAIAQLSGNAIKGTQCTTMAISMHFFYLAAFFWLNTMCFNIWWTFRDFRPTSLEKGQELVRLRIYQVYAWGVPFIIMTIAIILDNLPDGYFLRPHFGKTKCGFEGDKEMLPYFYGPVGFLLFVNLLLFASTARQLTCGLWKRDDVKSTTERSALGRVCMKLVVVMGVTWVADVLSWAHNVWFGGSLYDWILPDLINALHGVFIFIVVGCQPQVLTAIKRFWSSKTGRCATNTTHGPQHSSSSQGLPSIGESVTNNTFTNTTSSKVPLETIC